MGEGKATVMAHFDGISSRGEVLSDVVYERIGAAIIDGSLAPGERLRDAELAEQLGVSRMPVREALQRLARIGLVEMSASRYTRVTTPTPELAQQTLEYTGYQAGLAMRMAIPRMTDDDLAQTVALIDAKITASDADDIPTLYAAARSLYAFVSARTGNTVFAVMMREAGLAMERNLRGLRPVLGDVAERGALYRELRAAVVARDRDGAERAVREQHGLGSRNLRVIGLDDLSPQP